MFGLVKATDLSIGVGMSTVAEIESAIAKLPTAQMLSVAAWLDDYRSMLQASENTFAQLDLEEGAAAGKQWLGE